LKLHLKAGFDLFWSSTYSAEPEQNWKHLLIPQSTGSCMFQGRMSKQLQLRKQTSKQKDLQNNQVHACMYTCRHANEKDKQE